MALYTTYLGYLVKMDVFPQVKQALEKMGLKDAKIYYVMRNRGNNAVAPSDELFNWWLQNQRGKEWTDKRCKHYKQTYLKQLETEKAKAWMKKVAEEAVWRDVVLVCYEKDHIYCHRSLLAQTIAQKFPEAYYIGEFDSNITFSYGVVKVRR